MYRRVKGNLQNIRIMRTLSKIAILIVLIFLTNCDFGDNRLKIINETYCDVYFRYSCDSLLNIEKQCIILNEKAAIDNEIKTVISNEFLPADSFVNVLQFGTLNGWKKLLLNECNRELYVFFFSPTTIEKYNWEDIVREKLYMERKRVTYSELKKSNWTIIYP
jgi:hypothetical protein